MKTIKISLLAAGMILGAGSAFAADNNSILGSIDSYSAISQSDMSATKGTYHRRARAFADATSTARGTRVITDTYTNTQACTINCGGGGASASSVSSSYAAAR